MCLSEAVIAAASQSYARWFEEERLWAVPYHAMFRVYGRDVFENGSASAFEWIYDEQWTKW